MTMSSKLSIVAAADLAETLDLGTRTAAIRRAFGTSLGNGTGTGLADKVFQDTRTIAPSNAVHGLAAAAPITTLLTLAAAAAT